MKSSSLLNIFTKQNLNNTYESELFHLLTRKMKQLLIALFALVMIAGELLATPSSPTPEAADTMKCAFNLSLYSTYLKKKMYDDAIGPWRQLFFECPASHVNIYTDGIKLMEHYRNKATDDRARAAYVDTIMMIYDQRMAYFGNHHRYPEGWIWGRKGIDILKYKGKDIQAVKEAIDCFNRSYQLQQKNVEPAVMFAWIQAARNAFFAGEMNENDFLSLYFRIRGYAEEQKAAESDSARLIVYNKLRDFSERMVLESVRNRCDVIEQYLRSTQMELATNADQLQHTLTLMENLACTGSEYYLALQERLYQLAPNSENLIRIARSAVKNKNFDKAREYYQKTLQENQDLDLIAEANYEWAVIEMSHYHNLAKAQSLARMAVQIKPDWGMPYLLLGNIYAQAAKAFGDNEFEQQSVYWAAVDKFLEAMKTDASLTEEAQKYVETYSQYFPDRETAFFYGYQEGEPCHIGSWINESTLVRFK